MWAWRECCLDPKYYLWTTDSLKMKCHQRDLWFSYIQAKCRNWGWCVWWVVCLFQDYCIVGILWHSMEHFKLQHLFNFTPWHICPSLLAWDCSRSLASADCWSSKSPICSCTFGGGAHEFWSYFIINFQLLCLCDWGQWCPHMLRVVRSNSVL